MTMFIPLISILLFILFSLGSSSASIYNYMEVLIGEKAAGMGGAFTGVADDATATFYNPAGITQIPFNSMSVSANAITFKARKGKFFLRRDEDLTSFDFIPNFWGVTASTSIGKVGFSIVVPESDNFELHENYSDVTLLGYDWNTARDDVTFKSDTYLIGPTYAFSVFQGLSAGLSLYLIYNTFTESVYNYWATDYLDPSDGLNYSLIWENSRGTNGSGTGFSGKLGLLYRISDRLQIGAVIRPPTSIAEDVRVHQIVYLSNINENNVVKEFKRGDAEGMVSYIRKLPYSSAIGIAYFPSDRMTLAIDLSYYGPADYAEKIKTLDENLQPAETARKVMLREVLNGNLGMEYMLTPQVPLRTGIFTDISAAPEVENINRAQATNINKYGMALSSGYKTANSTVIAGIKYSIGRGYGTAPDYSTQDISFSFKKERYAQTDIAIFISGTHMF